MESKDTVEETAPEAPAQEAGAAERGQAAAERAADGTQEAGAAVPAASPVQEASSRDCALIAAKAADAKKATDIMVQEVRDRISVTDYFVIATAANRRQVEAIVDEVEERVRKEAHAKPLHREGTEDGMWALLDYGNFVVHVFQPETREYYRLEALWNDAPVIDLAKEAGLVDVEYSDRIAKLLGKK